MEWLLCALRRNGRSEGMSSRLSSVKSVTELTLGAIDEAEECQSGELGPETSDSVTEGVPVRLGVDVADLKRGDFSGERLPNSRSIVCSLDPEIFVFIGLGLDLTFRVPGTAEFPREISSEALVSSHGQVAFRYDIDGRERMSSETGAGGFSFRTDVVASWYDIDGRERMTSETGEVGMSSCGERGRRCEVERRELRTSEIDEGRVSSHGLVAPR